MILISFLSRILPQLFLLEYSWKTQYKSNTDHFTLCSCEKWQCKALSPQKDPLYPWKSTSSFQCHFVPVGDLTRGWWLKKKAQSVTLVAPENMEISDFCVWENGKHCLVKKSGIWIGSFNCVQSESGQILLWSSRAWRKFICKLHPIFGEIAPFSNSSPDAKLTQNYAGISSE